MPWFIALEKSQRRDFTIISLNEYLDNYPLNIGVDWNSFDFLMFSVKLLKTIPFFSRIAIFIE